MPCRISTSVLAMPDHVRSSVQCRSLNVTSAVEVRGAFRIDRCKSHRPEISIRQMWPFRFIHRRGREKGKIKPACMQITTPIGSPSGDVSYDPRPCIPRHSRHKRAFGTPGHNRRWQRQGLLRALGGLAAIELTTLCMCHALVHHSG